MGFVVVSILISGLFIWSYRRIQKLQAKCPPPPPGASDQAKSDWLDQWRNLNVDENLKMSPRRIKISITLLLSSTLLFLITAIVMAVIHSNK
jgi:hypothetical protein